VIDYVGDLSRADARLLRALAEQSEFILEFGCGASTQIFAAYGRRSVDAVETDPAWIEKTRRNLAALDIRRPVAFTSYLEFRPTRFYDLVFVDGIDELRQAFALAIWPSLSVDGLMAFHDTRRTEPHGESTTTDVQNVCAVIERYSTEIASVEFNRDDSNITVVAKRAPLPYEDWNLAERRTLQQIGLA
jgi:predicted O-methyltransferase YrrM